MTLRIFVGQSSIVEWLMTESGTLSCLKPIPNMVFRYVRYELI